MLNIQLWGLDSRMHHLVNLFFHMINAVLLFFVLRSMTGAFWRSAFVAAVFALLLLDYWPLGRICFREEAAGYPSGVAGRKVCGIRELVVSPAVLDKVPLIIVSLVVIYIVTVSLQVAGTVVPFEKVSMRLRIENAIVSYVAYLGKVF